MMQKISVKRSCEKNLTKVAQQTELLAVVLVLREHTKTRLCSLKKVTNQWLKEIFWLFWLRENMLIAE